jgi:hypothetical protein
MLLSTSAALSAHRRDEYLQAARIAVSAGRFDIELDLTPGVAVATRAIADLDGDRDGLVSAGEQQAYARRVLGSLSVDVDGRSVQLQLRGVTLDELDSLGRGEGAVRLRASGSLPMLARGAHRLVFRNRHQPEGSVYLANALVPETDRVVITGQRRDEAQRDLTVDFSLQLVSSRLPDIWLVACGLAGVMTWRLFSAGRRRWAARFIAAAGTSTSLPARLRTLSSK